MANPDRPNGFKASPLQEVSQYETDASASAIYPQDMVILESDGNVDIATAGATALIGAAVSYSAGSTAGSIRIADNRDQRYIAQDDGDGTTPAQTHVGNNCDIVATAGDSTLLQSRQEIDISTVGTGTAQIRLLEILEHPEYTIGANSLWKCVLNEHNFNDTTGV